MWGHQGVSGQNKKDLIDEVGHDLLNNDRFIKGCSGLLEMGGLLEFFYTRNFSSRKILNIP